MPENVDKIEETDLLKSLRPITPEKLRNQVKEFKNIFFTNGANDL